MSIEIKLERSELQPGSTLRGRVTLTPLAEHADRKVELSVLWTTEGKGDTDLGVVLHRILTEGGDEAASGDHDFEVKLPLLPVSWSGTLIKIRWVVRARRLARFGDDLVEDVDFLVRWPA